MENQGFSQRGTSLTLVLHVHGRNKSVLPLSPNKHHIHVHVVEPDYRGQGMECRYYRSWLGRQLLSFRRLLVLSYYQSSSHDDKRCKRAVERVVR